MTRAAVWTAMPRTSSGVTWTSPEWTRRPSRRRGPEYWQFCFGPPHDPAETKQKLDVYQSAYAHLMGRAAYQGMAGALPTANDHPFTDILNAARKVVFSRSLRTAQWANTTIAAGHGQEPYLRH